MIVSGEAGRAGTRDTVAAAAWTGLAAAVAGRPQIRHAEAHIVDNDGKAVALTGLSWSGFSGEALERKGAAELDRIWSWAVARGYTQETGEYVELSGVLGIQQGLREHQERRQGLSRP